MHNPTLTHVFAVLRIHEDTQRFARGVETICVVLLDGVMTLIVFSPVLVDLGRSIQPSPRTGAWLLLLCAGVAAAGMAVSIPLGWKLIDLEVQNQKTEANLRKRLVLNEEEQSRHNAHLEPDTIVDQSPKNVVPSFASELRHTIDELKDNYVRLYNRFALFSLWLGAFEQAVVLLPYMLVAPLLYATAGRVTLGKVSQTSHAFGHVFGALSILSDRWVEFTEFMSVVRRLREWERVLGQDATTELVDTHVSSTESGSVRFE